MLLPIPTGFFVYSPGVYIPIDRRIAIAEKKTLPSASIGAVLFADISGFTPLTDILVQELGAQRGVEELTAQINAVYSALIAEVHRFRGSVIGFAGDAITCWFGSWLDLETDPNLLAVACAHAMQETMRLFGNIQTPGGQQLSLHIKISIATGHVRRFVVGDPKIIRFDVIAGETVNRMARGMDLAKQGEIIVDENMAREIGHLVMLGKKRTNDNQTFHLFKELSTSVGTSSWQETTDGYLDLVAGENWLLPPVESALQGGQESYLAGFRPAAALFVKFDGLDYDDDRQVDRKMDVFIQRVQKILAKFGGSMIQLTTGDKGTYLYSAFGAPVAYDNNAYRAVSAAIDIVKEAQALEFITNIQIGISQGEMRVGLYGSPTRRTYGVLGNEVNIAARLMSQAQSNHILVSKRVVEEVDELFAFRSLGSIKISGFNEKLTVYDFQRVLKKQPTKDTNAANADRMRIPIVGRKPERQFLLERLQKLSQTRTTNAVFKEESPGGAVFIEGEAGIGKSRLLEELVNNSRLLDVIALKSTASSIEQSTPYFVWRGVFQHLFALDRTKTPAEQQERIVKVLQSSKKLFELAPLLNTVLPIELPESRITMRMTGQVREESAKSYFVELLKRLHRGAPKVIILDDAQWMDDASWSLALQVYQSAPRLLLVFGHLPLSGALPYAYQQMIHADQTDRLTLQPLSAEETLQLVYHCLGVTNIPKETAQMILAKTEGHPFYTQELAFSLKNNGMAGLQAQSSNDGTGPVAVVVPDAIEGVIISRIDSLPPEEQLTLKVASVIGRTFSFEILKDVYPSRISVDQLRHQIKSLRKLDIVPVEKAGKHSGEEYVFRQALTRDVAYNRLLFSQRRRLHRAVAEWYERRHAKNLTQFYPLLSYHWMQAENQEKHVDYLAKASQLALQNGNYKEVLQYYENPLTVEEGKNASPLEEASRNRQLAQAYYGLGQLPLAKEKLKNALEILEKKTEVTRSGFSLRKSLQGLFRAQETENNDNIVSSRETRNELAQIHRLLADLAYWANDAQVWENEASASIKEIEKITSAREIAKTHAVYANVTRVAGHTRNSQKHYEIAADSLSRILGKADQAEAMMRLAELDLIDGRWLPAERLLTRAVRNALQTGASQHFGSSLGMLHRFFHLRGFFIQSVQSAQGILDVAQRSDNQLQTGWGLAGMAEGLLRLGRWEQAVARAHESLKFRPAQDRLTGLVVAGVLTNGYLQRGSADRALEQAYQTHEVLAKAKPTSLHMLEVYCGLAEIYLHATRIGRPADAKQRLIDILRWFDEYAKVFPVARPRSLMYQGRAHLLSGDMERAISAWKQGAQLAFSQGLLYDFGLCAFELGAKSSLPTREKREFRLRALDMFTRLGLKSEVSQLRALK